jgi:hypothetical protein
MHSLICVFTNTARHLTGFSPGRITLNIKEITAENKCFTRRDKKKKKPVKSPDKVIL